MIESTKIIQSLCFLIQKVKRANKLKIVKLLYLADKYHIVRYGRTVTGDEYWAMDYGPVGSTTKDLLSLDQDFLSQEYDQASRFIKKKGKHDFIIGETCSEDDLDMLSETDKEAINFVVDKFGDLTSGELISYTHKYPEWSQYEELFLDRRTKRERIETSELLSLLDDDCLAVSDEHVDESKEIFNGTFT